jgi:HJR/Mrr/RecB family endonuclease
MAKAFYLVAAVFLGGVISMILSAMFSNVLMIVFPIFAFYFYQLFTTKIRVKETGLKSLETQLTDLLNNDIDLIARAYRRTVSSNSFGKKNYTNFKKELLEYLFDNTNSSEVLRYQSEFGEFQIPDQTIHAIEAAIEDHDKTGDYTDDMDPYEYEHFCATQFKLAGWDEAEATSGSSDQGVDVVAKRGDDLLVAQCKKYSKPVGNSAVQEVVAGMKYYEANIGIVISTSGFTTSAEKLAIANDIKLIHHSEIKNL